MPYEADVPEDAEPGTTIFNRIFITDKDSVGENLDIVCIAHEQNPDACFKYALNKHEFYCDNQSNFFFTFFFTFIHSS